MAKMTHEHFKELLNESINDAILGGLAVEEICYILKNKVKDLASEIILYSGTHCTCSWKINNAGVLKIYPTDGKQGKIANYDPVTATTLPWQNHAKDIVKVVIEPGVSTYEDASLLFYKLSNCITIDLRGLDLSNAVDMSGMFFGCSSLSKIEVGAFSVSRVERINRTFYGCDKLQNKTELENYILRANVKWTPPKKKKAGDSVKERDIKPR